MKRIVTVLMTYFVVLSAICNLSFSQQKSDSLSLYNVNGWRLFFVDPPPYNVYDTLMTGMQILPVEENSADSAQLFQQYGPSGRIGNEWNMGVHWDRNTLTQPYFMVPKYWLIEMRVETVEKVFFRFDSLIVISLIFSK